ncbi:hypothetical protein QBC38DRAFT_147450 [Podospora fimiseda]|uniref:Uncharacterized protein n=1 Tax=Podospora fimiseda TaxID=252190 RepID=A0AAN7BZ75_9PEZI|nr:hypothetical protein QBC38DRAFT_147450 [Podospora fimiseda]
MVTNKRQGVGIYPPEPRLSCLLFPPSRPARKKGGNPWYCLQCGIRCCTNLSPRPPSPHLPPHSPPSPCLVALLPLPPRLSSSCKHPGPVPPHCWDSDTLLGSHHNPVVDLFAISCFCYLESIRNSPSPNPLEDVLCCSDCTSWCDQRSVDASVCGHNAGFSGNGRVHPLEMAAQGLVSPITGWRACSPSEMDRLGTLNAPRLLVCTLLPATASGNDGLPLVCPCRLGPWRAGRVR